MRRIQSFPPSPAGWLVGLALMVWARSVVSPDVAILRAAVFASEGLVRSLDLSGEARARALGEALGRVWAVATVAIERSAAG